MIQARDNLGMSRQIFFVSLGGFDTHADQLASQAGLLARLDAAMASFYQATEELAVASRSRHSHSLSSAEHYYPPTVAVIMAGEIITSLWAALCMEVMCMESSPAWHSVAVMTQVTKVDLYRQHRWTNTRRRLPIGWVWELRT